MRRLAAEGMRFDRCLVTNSICGPSRAVILTGKYSHLNGFYNNTNSRFDGAQVTFPKLLRQAGYQYSWAGENVAYNFGYADPVRTLAQQWWGSSGHRRNILATVYTVTGIGVARGASGRTYGVQLFASPA